MRSHIPTITLPSLADLPVVEIEPGHVIYAAGPDFPIRFENNERLAALTPVQGVARYSNGAHQPADGHALPLIEDECSLSVPHVHLSFPYSGAVVIKDLENIAYPMIAHAYQAFGLNLQDAIDDSWSATDSEENIEKFKAVFRATVGS